MTPSHRIELVLAEDGKLLLDHLPFRAGQAVEVIVLPTNRPVANEQSLTGMVLHYDRPTDPVETWHSSAALGRADIAT